MFRAQNPNLIEKEHMKIILKNRHPRTGELF